MYAMHSTATHTTAPHSTDMVYAQNTHLSLSNEESNKLAKRLLPLARDNRILKMENCCHVQFIVIVIPTVGSAATLTIIPGGVVGMDSFASVGMKRIHVY